MLKKLRQFFIDFYDLKELLENQFALQSNVEVKLLRHLLGSIDLSDIKEEELVGEDRTQMLGRIILVYPDLERMIKKFIRDQETFAMTESNDLSFPRGTVNGLSLILEELQVLRDEYKELTKPKEEFDEHKVLASLLEETSRVGIKPGETKGENE